MKIEICQDTRSTIVWSLAILAATAVILTCMTFGYITERRDQAIQQNMLELGYSPMDVSCSYNITQPACIVHAQKELTNDDATH